MTKIVSFSFNRYSLLPIAAGIFYVIRSFSFSLIPNNEYKCSLFFENCAIRIWNVSIVYIRAYQYKSAK